MTRTPLSVVILTLNEEKVIARAIDSVLWADEVVVVDSGSSDRTRAICEDASVRFVEQPWLGWIRQRNEAARLASNDWVFFIDADEIVSGELRDSIVAAFSGEPERDSGFVVTRLEEFLGVIMPSTRRRSKRDNFVRIYNRKLSEWDPATPIHESVKCTGRRIPLRGSLFHWRNYSLRGQIETYLRNSDIESEMLPKGKSRGLLVMIMPPLRFFWVFLFCGCFRLGMRGFLYSCLKALAEFIRQARAWERFYAPPVDNPP